MKNVLLFPGGFKPFHDGHLSILESYISNIDKIHIDEVRIYISKKDREFITADTSLWFINSIKDNISNMYDIDLNVSIPDIPSPVCKCYNDVSTCLSNDKFCLVTSNKGNDINRKYDFVNSYLEGGKRYNSNIGEQTVFINTNCVPKKYTDRTDVYNGEYISATIVRNDIKERNYEQFKTSYMYMLTNNIVDEKTLREYYDKLTMIN